MRGSVVSRVLAFGFVGFDLGEVSFTGVATRTSIPALEEFRRKGLKRDNRLGPVGLCADCEEDVSGEIVRSSVSMISESE